MSSQNSQDLVIDENKLTEEDIANIVRYDFWPRPSIRGKYPIKLK